MITITRSRPFFAGSTTIKVWLRRLKAEASGTTHKILRIMNGSMAPFAFGDIGN